MTDYVISVSMAFVGPPDADDDDFGHFIDAAATEFEKISDGDLTVGATLTARTADFSAVIPGSSQDDALARYLVDLRTALHAAGCSTPGWPVFAVRDQTVRELQPA
jgi:hypothetical protein